MNPRHHFLQPRFTFFINIVVILAMMVPTLPGVGTVHAQAEKPTPTPVLISPAQDESLPESTPTPEEEQEKDTISNAVLDSNNVSLISQYGGALRAVALDGIYAYVGGGNRMVVMNTTASPPTIVSRTQLFADDVRDIAILTISSVKYAFLAVGNEGIKVVNITDPTNPILVGSGYNTNGVAKGVAVASISGTAYAFVADGASGALSLDVSTPSAPAVVDTLAATTDITSIAVSNLSAATYYAYVADLGAGIVQYDVTTTGGNFTPTGNTDAGASTNPNDVFVTNVGATYYVIVADGPNFRRFDSILGSGTSAAPTNAQSVFGLGNFAYVSNGSTGDVTKFDITATPPTVSCTYDGAGTAYGLAVDGSGNNVYLAEWGFGLRVITAATCVSASVRYSPSVIDLDLVGNYAYLAADVAGLQIVDISTPAAPVAPTSANYGAEATLRYTKRVAILGSDAFALGGTAIADQNRKITISTPASPVESVSLAPWTVIPNGIDVDGSLTYVAVNAGGATSGLYVRNMADLSGLTAYAAGTMASEDVAVTSAYVYVADGANGFKVFNKASILAGPVAARTYDTTGSAVGLAISNDEHYAYVADDNNGLVALNISNTSITTLADSLSLAGNAKDVALSGNYAFVAVDTGGLRIVDVSDPTNLREVGFYSTPGNAVRVEVFGPYAYVAGSTAGMLVLQYPASTYTITGKVTDTSTASGLPGVVVTASFGRSATTDSTGNYSIVDIPAGSFSLTAALPGYSCSPALVTGAAPGDLTGKNFNCTPGAVGPYTISGRVVDATTLPIVNATVTLSNGLSATTNGSGNYSITGVSLGTYTILPMRGGYTFAPVTRTVSVSTNLSNQNFTGSVVSGGTYTVSGTVTTNGVTPIVGVIVYASNGLTSTSDASGNYSLSSFGAGTYAVMPVSSSYMFSPVSTTVTLSAGTPSLTQDFIASSIPPTYSISGQITDATSIPIADVTVYLNTGVSTTTNASGNYGFSGLAAGSYTIMPSKAGYTFSPVVMTVYVAAEVEDQATASFSGSPSPVGTYTVSGRITDAGSGISGIGVYASNGLSAVSDSSGNYTLSGFSAGTFAVMPISAGIVFSPISRSVNPSAVSPNITGQDFAHGTTPPGTYSISGHITDSVTSSPIAGVMVTDGAGHTANTDASGNYTLSDLSAGSYTLTASKSGYTFTASFTNPVTIIASNLTDKNFVGASSTGNYTISGTIRDGSGSPMPGVTISDGQGRTTTSDSYGNYILSGYSSGSYNVTATRPGYACTPYPILVTVPPSAVANFTCSVVYYTVSGLVTDAKNKGIASVTISAGSGYSVTTDSNGNYTLSLPLGTYILTPSKTDYVFSPAMRNVNVSANVGGQSFYGATGITDVVKNGNMETNEGWVIPFNRAGYTSSEAGGLWAEIESEPLAVQPDSATEELLKDMTAAYTSDEVLSGTRSLRVGIVDPTKNVAGYSEARQYVTIPWSSKTSVLRFWLFPKGGPPDGKDLQIVTLLNTHMKQKERLLTMRSNSGQWEYYEFDLTKYRGQTFWIYFGVYNDGKGSIMGMYVDDVALLCASTDTPPLPPVTPTVMPTPGPGPTTTPSPGGYSISGRVMSTSGIALAGVSILANDGHMAVTNVNGDYVLSGLSAGTFTVTPYLVGSTFSPTSASVTLSAANPSVSAINFVATPLTPSGSLSISGIVKDTGDVPIANVTVIDGVGHTATTSAGGEYTLGSLAAGTYTISPAVAGYVFSPASRTVTLSVSMTGQDFTGTAVSGGSYTVSGHVSDTGGVAISGATVQSNDGHTATTNTNGDYTITGLTAGSYVISPSKPSYTFIPVAQTVSLANLNNASGVNFTGYSGTYPSYSIMGRVTLGTAGLAEVTISDGNGHTALTNSNGDYNLSGLFAGSYTISAAKDYYSISASFTNPVSVASSNVTGKDFVASAAPTSRTNPDLMKAYFIPASAKPKIDGDFPSSSTDYPDPTQWNTYKKEVTYKIVGRSKMHGQDSYGVWDIKADVLFGWDNQYFYIFSKVYDDIYVQEADDYTFLYRGDSVEFAMDVEVPKDYSSTLLTSDDYRVGMSGATKNPGNRDFKTIVWSPASKTGIPSWVNMAARSFCELNVPWVCYDSGPPPAKYIDYTGYMLEAAVQWSALGITPEVGQHYGFAFSVNDNDQFGKELQEKVLSTVNDPNVFFDPTTWSDIELVN